MGRRLGDHRPREHRHRANARLQPGDGGTVAIEIRPQPPGSLCVGEFTFFSEDNGGGLSTAVYVEFVVE